jgi:hypothetical protein
MKYTIPQNLLSTKNSKTIKGEKFGYTTYIMYLAPHKQNSKGVNLCAKASKGCAEACLFKSGAARFDNVQQGKINKTEYFIHDRKRFMEQLVNEIIKIEAIHEKIVGDEQLSANGKVLRYKKFAIRLNGTSDFPFENLKIDSGIFIWNSIFERFPNVQFYDYTKLDQRFDKIQPKNYHLTFSRSEDNHTETVDLLNRGVSVAVVFGIKDEKNLPKTYLGFPVINGDESDLRFLDDSNVIVGLKYKLMTGKGTKGMNKKMLEENKFIVDASGFSIFNPKKFIKRLVA